MTEKEVLELIEQAAVYGSTALSLAGCGLTSLPTEIGRLSGLTRLNVNHNQLTLLPGEIVELSNLSDLYLRGNPLELPPLEVALQGMKAV